MASHLPPAIEKIIHELTRLPGIGRKGAERLVLHLLRERPENAQSLAGAIADLHNKVRHCQCCGNWAERDRCVICENEQRNPRRICVIEQPSDIWAFEQEEIYDGLYHVLGGVLSPMAGVTADDLAIDALEDRIEADDVEELIIATNPSVDGDATAHYLWQRLGAVGSGELKITRIATGVPIGGHLDYADPGTLRHALEGRRPLN